MNLLKPLLLLVLLSVQATAFSSFYTQHDFTKTSLLKITYPRTQFQIEPSYIVENEIDYYLLCPNGERPCTLFVGGYNALNEVCVYQVIEKVK